MRVEDLTVEEARAVDQTCVHGCQQAFRRAAHTAGAEGFLCEPERSGVLGVEFETWAVNWSDLYATADDPCRESGLLLLRCCLNSSGEARPRYFFVGAVLCSAGLWPMLLRSFAAFAALLHAETLTSHQTRETPRGTTHVSNSKL